MTSLGLPCSAADPAPIEKLENTEAFKVAYGISYGFDWCGENAAGALYRRAIVDKFDHCPFSPDANRGFHRWAEETSLKADRALHDYVAQYGHPPERLDGMKTSCREQSTSPEYIELKHLIARYGDGNLSANELLTGPCAGSSGAP